MVVRVTVAAVMWLRSAGGGSGLITPVVRASGFLPVLGTSAQKACHPSSSVMTCQES
jgi:hypothetical protein